MAESNSGQSNSQSINDVINILRSPQFLNILTAAVSPQNSNQNPSNSEMSRQSGSSATMRPSFGSVGAELRTTFRSTRTSQELPQFNFIGSQRKRANNSRPNSKNPKTPYPGFTKDITLLPEKNMNKVPRGGIKTTLEKHNFVLHNVPLMKEWNASTLKEEILKLFSEKISTSIDIEFLKASGSVLVRPKMPPGIALSGDVVHRCWGKSTLYIRPKNDLEFPYNEDLSLDTMDLTEDELPEVKIDNASEVTVRRNELEPISEEAQCSSSSNLRSYSTNVAELLESASSEMFLEPSDAYDPGVYADYVALFQEDQINGGHISDNDEPIGSPLNTDSLCENQKDIKDIILNLNSKIDTEKTNDINVNRNNVIDGAYRAFKRSSFNENSKINIVFTDNYDHGEGAVDLEGPSREFFRLLMKAVMESVVFEGPIDARNLAYNAQAMRENKYFLAGFSIALSLVHGGPGPHSFSKTLFESLIKDPLTICVSPSQIADRNLQERVQKLEEAETLQELQELVENLDDIRSIAGCLSPVLHISQKAKIIEELSYYLVLGRHSGNLTKFKEGLSKLNVLSEIVKYPESFKPIMLIDGGSPITRSRINSLFKIEYSEQGGNRYMAENEAIGYWRDYLIDIEEGNSKVSLTMVLIFATGADKEPPLGFILNPTIGFLHENVRGTEMPSKFPMSNTCSLRLYLPVIHKSYEEFKDNLDEGFICAPCFGLA